MFVSPVCYRDWMARLGAVAALAISFFHDEAAANADTSATSPEAGYDLGEVQSPRAVAMGGAQNAFGSSTTALFLNPANLPLASVYHFEGLAAVSPEARRQSYGGAVADSSTSRLAGGFSGVWTMLDPEGFRRTWTDLRLGLGYALGDKFAVGATGRYLRTKQSVSSGPLHASLASDGTRDDPLVNTFTFDVGATLVPIPQVHIGVVGHNLTNPGNGLAPTTLAGGIGYGVHQFTIEADGLVDFTTWSKPKARLMGGAEVFLADRYAGRVGYRYDDGLRTHSVSLGGGYVAPRWSFELSVRRDVAGEHPATMIVAGLRVFYDSGKSMTLQGDSM